MKVLAGDIGGTKTLLAVLAVEADGVCRTLVERRYDSPAFDSLDAVVRRFCEDIGPDARAGIERAGFGVAGPVADGESRTPNLPWHIRAARVAETLGLDEAVLVNDFSAVGHGLKLLGPEHLATLQAGEPRAGGAIALIGAGTGLGQGFMVHQDGAYAVFPSEGGHSDFAPRTPEQDGLLVWLREHVGRVSYERVLCGSGLAAIWRYLVERGRGSAPAEVVAAMAGEDPAAVVSRFALEGRDETCARALDLFVSVYGAEAGNLALKYFATGGVFVAGGIAPRILERLRTGPFLASFRDKGRLSDLVERVPVHVVLEGRVGLLGAAAAAVGRALGPGRVLP